MSSWLSDDRAKGTYNEQKIIVNIRIKNMKQNKTTKEKECYTVHTYANKYNTCVTQTQRQTNLNHKLVILTNLSPA